MAGSLLLHAGALVARGRWVPFYDPTSDPVRALTLQHRRSYTVGEVLLWSAAILFMITDVVSTLIGLTHPGITERMAVTRLALQFGWPGLVVKKTIVLVMIFTFWSMLPRPYRLAIPATAAGAGYLTVENNLIVLSQFGILPVF